MTVFSNDEHHNQRGIGWREFIRGRISEVHTSGLWLEPVIDIGSGTSSLVRPVFPGATTLDVDASCHPDVVGDILQGLPSGEGPGGTVFAIEVLEHVLDPWKATANIAKSMSHGGWLYVSVPFSCVGFHANDVFRFTEVGLRTVLSGWFTDVVVEEYWSPLNPNKDGDAASYLPDGLFASARRAR